MFYLKKYYRPALRQIRMLLLTFMPQKMRRKILLGKFALQTKISEQLVIKLAETDDEVRQAFKLHHDCYAQEGLSEANKSGLKMSKYQTIPQTSIIVATLNNKVVGTLSIVSGGPFALPIEQGWNIDDIKAKHDCVVECSALAIDKTLKKQAGSILFSIMNYAWKYSSEYLKADAFVAAVKTYYSPFYQDVLMYEKITTKAKSKYQVVDVLSASAFYLNLNTAAQRYKYIYESTPENKNLYKFFVEDNYDNHIYPVRPYYRYFDYSLSTKLLEELLSIPDAHNLSKEDRKKLMLQLCSKKYQNLFNSNNNDLIQRKNIRLPFRQKVVVANKSETLIGPGKITSLSRTGIALNDLNNEDFKVGDSILIRVELSENLSIKLEGQIVYSKDAQAGVHLVKNKNSQWTEFMNFQESGLGQLQESIKTENIPSL